MKINSREEISGSSTAIILPFFQDDIHHDLIQDYSGQSHWTHFKAKRKEIAIFSHSTLPKAIILLGLGSKDDNEGLDDGFRMLFHKESEKIGKEVSIYIDHLSPNISRNIATGLLLSQYRIDNYKSKDKEETRESIIHIVHKQTEEVSIQIRIGESIAKGMTSAMFLIDQPSNIKTPAYLADYCVDLGKEIDFKVNILGGQELVEHGLHALLAVGQGSQFPPRFIIMEYRSTNTPSKKHLGLVGKGITFDTGGISIKSSANLHYMKSDMGGAAAVIGCIAMASSLGLDIDITAIIPAAENAVDAMSIRPSDVIQSYAGKTIEIIDTDAEGRLVLADGLAYLAKNYETDYVIDLATLTGSCVATLGYAAAGMFTNNDELAEALSEAGYTSEEKVWRLPLWKDYESDIQSDIADVRNYSGRPLAGAITAAKFLEYFIPDHKAWAHLDIAGVAFGDSEYTKMKSAKGYGIKLLYHFIQTIINK